MIRILLLLVCTFSLNSALASDPEDSLIRATIDRMFLGMKTHDSSMVASCFYPDNSLESVYTNLAGKLVLHGEKLSEFLEAIEKNKKEIWDERIHDVEIRIDEPMAMAWVPYEFYLDDKFSHEGVNLIQLVKEGNQWFILSIMDTRRRNPEK